MLSISQSKYLQSLKLGKFRQKYDKFVAEGDKCCYEFLRADTFIIDAIYATPSWIDQNPVNVSKYREILQSVTNKEMKKISLLKTPTDILIVCDMRDYDIKNVLRSEPILYLDAIQNPGNLGTMIRTADWYGVTQIVCSSDTVDYYHPKVVQAAMGSHNRMTSYIASLDLVKACSLLPILGTTLQGEPLERLTDRQPFVIVMGNEGKGIRPPYISLLDRQISIVGADGRVAESLNAGIACAVVLDRLFG